MNKDEMLKLADEILTVDAVQFHKGSDAMDALKAIIREWKEFAQFDVKPTPGLTAPQMPSAK